MIEYTDEQLNEIALELAHDIKKRLVHAVKDEMRFRLIHNFYKDLDEDESLELYYQLDANQVTAHLIKLLQLKG